MVVARIYNFQKYTIQCKSLTKGNIDKLHELNTICQNFALQNLHNHREL